MDVGFNIYLLKTSGQVNFLSSYLNHICFLNCTYKFGLWGKHHCRIFFFIFQQIKLLNVVTFFPGAKLFGKCNMNPLIALAALEMCFYLQWINSLPNVYPNCASDILLLLRIFIKCYNKNGLGTTWLFFFSTSNKRKGGGGDNIACREQFRVSGNDLTRGSRVSTDATDTYFAVVFSWIYTERNLSEITSVLLLAQILTGQSWQGVCIIIDSLQGFRRNHEWMLIRNLVLLRCWGRVGQQIFCVR